MVQLWRFWAKCRSSITGHWFHKPRLTNTMSIQLQAAQKGQMLVLAGTSHPELAQLVASKLGIRLGEITIYHKQNRETQVEIKESVRGKDVYIIQTGTKDTNNDIMELMIIAYACRTSAANSIIGVIPYLPYSKQSKMRKRGCIVGKLVATMLGKAGFSHVITMDLHQKEIQGFFSFPVDNLRASAFLIDYIQTSLPDYRNAVIVARNPNSVKRATSYAERLRLGIAVIHGEERMAECEEDDGRTSPPLQDNTQVKDAFGLELLPQVAAKEKPPFNVVGDVGGRIAIIVDDMIDDVVAFVKVAEILKDRGAYKVLVVATHGILSSDAPRLIEDSSIDEVVVTNTIPHEVQKMQCHKIKTVDISVLLCEAIRRIHNNESMSYLFRNVGLDD
ncbi:phosphoribosyl pyrophosphate synthase-associated protein 1-like isoform X2 [Biomphalaria glabrata]|uniref:Phosphoribosyl pyrophosphate synthase-associated protein 1-like isoform X2 n=1 Tax=Biomphalaria glabrata TaxID=6526 RepID=A0A9W2ZL21_BIOGL|nr:phosphoribosyl pyrophosphate synthase-associated protein 1-like isoform X2 [Biomphalaria glabrata]